VSTSYHLQPSHILLAAESSVHTCFITFVAAVCVYVKVLCAFQVCLCLCRCRCLSVCDVRVDASPSQCCSSSLVVVEVEVEVVVVVSADSHSLCDVRVAVSQYKRECKHVAMLVDRAISQRRTDSRLFVIMCRDMCARV